MAAANNMNKHETFSGVISFEEINFSKSTTENNSTNNFTFSEDEEEEANMYDSQGNIPNKNCRISHGLQKGFLSPLRTKISNIGKCVELKTLLSAKK